MKYASSKYKAAMQKQLRDRAYGIVSVGIVNKVAQANATPRNTFYLSNNKNVLKLGEVQNTYASFEEDQTKADGKYMFPPENNAYLQLLPDVGIVSSEIMGSVRIRFPESYDIKGLTIDFGDNYPTEFSVTNGIYSYTYELDNNYFTCTDVFDDTRYLTITPIHFENSDNKRLRINYILMGIGVYFDNNNIVSVKLKEEVSYITEDLPALSTTVKVIDENKLFNVDDESSFLAYLADGQELDISLGQTLSNGKIEYIDLPTTYLANWGSNGMYMSFTGTDRFKLMDGTYSEGNTIHTRTLYDDAIAVLTAAGLEPDEYFVDTVLEDIVVENPLPTATYAQCLQLIANAGRCHLRQSFRGKILIEGGFETIIEPTELTVTATGEAAWSNADNVRFGTDVVYADFTRNFASADGSMLFIPEDSSDYLLDGTTFVSSEIADSNGRFTTNPTLTFELPATFTFYGLQIAFNGNPARGITMRVYRDNELLETHHYRNNNARNPLIITEELISFNKLEFEFTQVFPGNRLLVRQISLGELTDYVLARDAMTEEPVGMMDKRVKDVQVKVFTFEPPTEEGRDPTKVEDSVFAVQELNSVGQTITFENQLISTMEHATLVARWLANYYANQISYQVKYRGDPRLDASDIIYMESEKVNNLQVEIESLELEFMGAYKGTLNLRRATNMLEEEEEEG